MKNDELMLKVENVSKIYKLGEIGGTTLRDELQRVWAKLRKKEDPTKKIGAKNYNKGEKFKALDNISFEVKKGERIGIIGHNGAGKSTLLKLISRVTGPTEGKIHLNGRVASMLEVGTGFADKIFVVFPIDGELHVASGSVYRFYQFEQSMGDRLTDLEWRQMLKGGYLSDDWEWVETDKAPAQPEWTQSYRTGG